MTFFPQQLEPRDPSRIFEEDEDEAMEDAEDVESEEDESESEETSKASKSGDSNDSSDEEEADPELRRKIEEALRVNGIKLATGDR